MSPTAIRARVRCCFSTDYANLVSSSAEQTAFADSAFPSAILAIAMPFNSAKLTTMQNNRTRASSVRFTLHGQRRKLRQGRWSTVARRAGSIHWCRGGAPDSPRSQRVPPTLNLGRHLSTMTQPEHESVAQRLSRNRAGRVLLHIVVILRSRRNLRWHLRGLLRDLLGRPTKTLPPPRRPRETDQSK